MIDGPAVAHGNVQSSSRSHQTLIYILCSNVCQDLSHILSLLLTRLTNDIFLLQKDYLRLGAPIDGDEWKSSSGDKGGHERAD